MVSLLFGQKIQMGGGDVVHRYGHGITAVSGVYDLQIAPTFFTHLNPAKVFPFAIEIAKFFLFLIIAEGTSHTGQPPVVTAK